MSDDPAANQAPGGASPAPNVANERLRQIRPNDPSPRGARVVALVAAAGIAAHLVLRFSDVPLRNWAEFLSDRLRKWTS